VRGKTGALFPAVLERCKDASADKIQSGFHLFVPEAHDAEAVRPEQGVACRIASAFGMLAAIDLDDQHLLESNEIEDVAFERNLPAEFHAIHLATADLLPEHGLGARGIVAHGASEGPMVFGRDGVRHGVRVAGIFSICNLFLERWDPSPTSAMGSLCSPGLRILSHRGRGRLAAALPLPTDAEGKQGTLPLPLWERIGSPQEPKAIGWTDLVRGNFLPSRGPRSGLLRSNQLH
jgi:hypothetical protein